MSDEQATPEVTDLGEIPAATVIETPAATDTRDKLLQAIGQEAQRVAENSAGQAATALETLARAYTLVSAGPAVASRIERGIVRVQDPLEIVGLRGETVTTASG
ncbi:hypothetical protein ACFWF7_33225 [Nocardia sp. NPDC060256]|uniref:hypothetical protein n=1 Tax=unclassified Nocardia TaxID=2637762 RepID=UPI0036563984